MGVQFTPWIKWWSRWTLTACTGYAQMSALPPLLSLLGIHALPVVNAVTRSLKSTAWFTAVRIWTIKIGFDPAADSIWIRSIKIGFNLNSILESVRTLVAVSIRVQVGMPLPEYGSKQDACTTANWQKEWYRCPYCTHSHQQRQCLHVGNRT